MSEFFLDIVNMSISASWLVLAVLVLRLILKKAPKWVNVLLWGIVAIRLICPVTIESALSLIPSTETISPEIMMDWTPEISTGIEPLDQVVNPVISTSFAPEPAASANPLQILIPVAANLWVIGALVMLLYTLVSYVSLRLKLRTAVILRDNIFQCETVTSPFVLGILRPRIYLPYTIDGESLNHVVAHEQAHIRRKDHWWKPLGFLLLAIHWFNPLMWLAYILLCRDIELACDEKVIAELGNEQRADYTQALVACSINRRRIAACPLAFGEVSVKARVKSVMNYRKPAFWVVLLAVVVCVAVAVCFLTDPAEENIPETAGEGFYLLIGADGVKKIQVSSPDSSGGAVNANGSAFKRGEKVYLEQLQGITDLRGVSVTALGENGQVIYGLSIPEGASKEEVVNTVGSDGWLLAPTSVLENVEITGKTYVYEHEGIMGNFTINLYDDGTFTYYEGLASSYFGMGTWQQDGSVITLSDDDQIGHPLTNKFKVSGDELIFMKQGSSNFIYVELEEGERFHYTGETFKNLDSAASPERTEYPFRATIPEIYEQRQEFESMQPAPDPSAAEDTDAFLEYTPLEELPETYTLEEAINDKCVILIDGSVRENADVWHTFVNQVTSGSGTMVRIVRCESPTETSPARMSIYDLCNLGKGYDLIWFENGKECSANYQYLRYFAGEAENENAEYDAYISYILTDDLNATRMELLLSYASSAQDAAIPHFEIYTDYINYPGHPDLPSEVGMAELITYTGANTFKYHAAYKEEKMLKRLQNFLSNAQVLDHKPEAEICCNLILFGPDGMGIELGLDAKNDYFVLGDTFYDYGPGYDAKEELLYMLGFEEWPQ